MAKARRPRTWVELFAARVGIRKAARVLALLTTWSVTEQRLGRPPTVEEYAEDWAMSLATAYRDLALFKEAQPFFDSPSGWVACAGVVDGTARVPWGSLTANGGA
jgi:hypothetical protein